MRKLLLLFICCLCLCGCGKEEIKKTRCIDYDDEGINQISWILSHTNKSIIKGTWTSRYKFDTLSEALNEEKRANDECKNSGKECSIERNDNTVIYSYTYICDSNTDIFADDCSYLKTIEEFENNNFECKEIN